MVREIINPYVAGPPLHTEDVFYGRHDIFESIKLKLRGRFQDNPILIYGQRRTGKTSILLQIQKKGRLGPEYLPVYINLQGMGLTRQGMSGLLYDIAVMICQSIGIDSPKSDAFSQDPQVCFRYTFLPSVLNKVGNRHLLLLFDEYETLEERVKTGTLEESVFSFLRTLVAGEPSVSFVFAGSHTPAELGGHYPSTFGRTVLQEIRVSFLGEYEATRLITEPAAGLMRYDSQAVEMILQLTSGHPFFIQLLCHNLFGRHTPAMQSLPEGDSVPITRQDVGEIIDETIASGENQLREIWTEYFSLKEKVVLAGASAALSRVDAPRLLVPSVHRVDIDAELGRFSSRFEDGEVTQILNVLTTEKDILRWDPRSSQYRFAVDLLRKWISSSQDLRDLVGKLPIVAAEGRDEKEARGRPKVARVLVVLVITCFLLAVLGATGWHFRGWWLAFTVRPTSVAMVTPVSAPTPTPSPTPTYTPTIPPTSTPTPTCRPTISPMVTLAPAYRPTVPPTSTPTNTPTPRPVRPELVAPGQGTQSRSPVAFQWTGRLSPGQAYQVTAYHLETGYVVQSGPLTTQKWTADLPAERYGEWRWRVSVIGVGSELVTSSEWMFWFTPFPPGPPGPLPEPEPEHKRPQ